MSFQWEDYNQVSKHLIDMDQSSMGCDPQAFYRAAVSRSYYAAFKTSEEWIEMNPHTNFVQPTTSGTHDAVISHINDHFGVQQNNGYRLRVKLASLKASRIKADYINDPVTPVELTDAENILTVSSAIIYNLKAYPVATR